MEKEKFVSEKVALFASFSIFLFFLFLLVLTIFLVFPKPKLQIQFEGPEKVKVGETFTIKVKVKNVGNVVVKEPEVSFQHPENAIFQTSLLEIQKLEETFLPKKETVLEFKSKVFGKEGEKVEFKVWVNYKRKNKSYSKFATFSTLIEKVPIDLILELPGKIPIYTSEKAGLFFRIKLFSQAQETIPSVIVKVFLPEKFIFDSSLPKEIEKLTFGFQKIDPQIPQQIEIAGHLEKGVTQGEKLNFKANLLVKSGSKEILLKEEEVLSEAIEPIFGVYQKINGQEKYFPSPGERLHFEIFFSNLTEKVQRDLTLSVILESNLFDLNSVQVLNGEIQGKYLNWKPEEIPKLRYLAPGDEGKVDFWVTLRKDFMPKSFEHLNAQIKTRVVIKNVESEFRTRVNSLVVLSQDGYYRDPQNFFENSGPHPPAVNEPTTYTIIWKVENWYNTIENIQITADLPPWTKIQSFKPTIGEFKFEAAKEISSLAFPDIPPDFTFERALQLGDSGQDVKYLQIILKKEVPHIFPPTLKVTGYFGKTTLEGVKAFQEKYKKEILEPQGLPVATGILDELTRKKLNEILKKGVTKGGGKVIWKIESLEGGVGIFQPSIFLAFQIEVLPSLAQKGKIIPLIGEVKFLGKDSWTNQSILTTAQAVLSSIEKGGEVRD